MPNEIYALFIGGPWDGERHSVERLTIYRVPEMLELRADLSSPITRIHGTRIHEYRLKRYADAEGRIEWRYVAEGIL